MREFFLILTAVFLFSCTTVPENGEPDWMAERPETDQSVFIRVTVEGDVGKDEIIEALAGKILNRIGISESGASAERVGIIKKRKEDIIDTLKGNEKIAGLKFIDSAVYGKNNKEYTSAIAEFDREEFQKFKDEILPMFMDENPEMDELEEEIKSALQNGFWGTAVMTSCKAVGDAEKMDMVTSPYWKERFVNYALQAVDRMNIDTNPYPDIVYNGIIPGSVKINFRLDPEESNRIKFKAVIPHSVRNSEYIEVPVYSSSGGTVVLNPPEIFKPGNYKLTLKPDRDFFYEISGIEKDISVEAIERIIDSLTVIDEYRVELDISKLPLGIYIMDYDALGKKIKRSGTSEKIVQSISSRNFDLRVIDESFAIEEFTDTGVLREIKKSAGNDLAFLLLGETQITGYNYENSWFSVSGKVNYSLIDMRTYGEIDSGSFVKQLDSSNGDKALSALYSEFSKDLTGVCLKYR